MESKQQDKRKSWLKGLGFLALAVIFFVVVAGVADTPNEKKATAKATCVIAAKSVPYFAEAVSKGRADGVNKIGGVLTRSVCVKLAVELQRNPDETADTPIQAQTPSGETTPAESVTLSELLEPPPAPEEAPGGEFDRLLACVRAYDAETEALLRKWCFDGHISP